MHTHKQATQGGGGWPMSVFLTPDLKPFVGGTYCPSGSTFGRPGFPTHIKNIAEQVHVQCKSTMMHPTQKVSTAKVTKSPNFLAIQT